MLGGKAVERPVAKASFLTELFIAHKTAAPASGPERQRQWKLKHEDRVH